MDIVLKLDLHTLLEVIPLFFRISAIWRVYFPNKYNQSAKCRCGEKQLENSKQIKGNHLAILNQ